MKSSEPVSLLVYLYTLVRSALGIAIVIPYSVFYSLLTIATGFMGFRDLCTYLIRQWGSNLLRFWGIHVEVRGEENLPVKGGGIIVFNHQSLFDIPVLLHSTGKHIRFGAKIELFRIPFFGRAMRAVGTLPIARENRSEVLKIYKEAESRFAQDFIFVLAPEGTRQKEPQIGRFKKGPFIFALNAGVPIIPAVIKGAHDVLPKKSLLINVGHLRRSISIEYLKPVATRGREGAKIDALVESVRASMVEVYSRESHLDHGKP